MKRNATKWWRVCRLALQCKLEWEKKKTHTHAALMKMLCHALAYRSFFPFAVNAVAIVGLSVMRWRRRACLSFKWKWPSKMAFMSCTVVACCSTHDAMHVYCILPYRMHCYLHKTKDLRELREKKPEFTTIYACMCVWERVLLFRSFSFKTVLVFVMDGSIHACMQSLQAKGEKLSAKFQE